MSADVLVLSADWRIEDIVPWQKAMKWVLDNKVYVAVEYAGRMIRSVSEAWTMPAVVVRKTMSKQRRVKKNRRGSVLARDRYTCMYCGVQPKRRSGAPRIEELTIDHVIPRAQAVNDQVYLPWSKRRVPLGSWENLLTACKSCNCAKGARTPDEASMTMRKVPAPPNPAELAWMKVFSCDVPPEWVDYLPDEAKTWRDYFSGAHP